MKKTQNVPNYRSGNMKAMGIKKFSLKLPFQDIGCGAFGGSTPPDTAPLMADRVREDKKRELVQVKLNMMRNGVLPSTFFFFLVNLMSEA